MTGPKRVLVTGATGGIGSAISKRFLDIGDSVVLADLQPSLIERMRDSLGAPDRTASAALDVRDAAGVETSLDAAWRPFGGLDVLVNCAGVYPSRPLLQMVESDWDAVLDVNLKGPFLVSVGFARRLVADGRHGQIVNITSGAARRARRGAAHYCTSKAGLEMLTSAFALELAPHGIRVNAVSPGFVDVESPINSVSTEYRNAIAAGIPLGRTGRPDDIAGAVVFLCGPEAEWITGSSLTVDGGSGAGNILLPLSGRQPEPTGSIQATREESA